MTTRPRLRRPGITGILAVALFAFLSAVFLTSGFGTSEGFPAGEITRSIGYAIFNLDGGTIESEGFLVAFIGIAIVLDAALDGAIMLAERDEEADG